MNGKNANDMGKKDFEKNNWNWKGFRKKQWWPNFKVLSWHSPGGTEESNEKPQSG
jgi:hypothetical protein